MLDFNYILKHNDIISNDDILTINYTTATGKGCFTVLMSAKFPTTAHNMKLFNEMFLKAENPEETARPLYNYLTKCADFLKNLRNKIQGVTDQEKKDRTELTNIIKKFKFF